MPVKLTHLVGPLDSVVPFISRKRHTRIAIRPADHVGWRHDNGAEAVMVTRSPENPEEWLTISEYLQCLTSVKARGLPFQSPHSRRLVLQPQIGDYGWFNVPGVLRRERRIFLDGQWIPDPVRRQFEYSGVTIGDGATDEH